LNNDYNFSIKEFKIKRKENILSKFINKKFLDYRFVNEIVIEYCPVVMDDKILYFFGTQ